LSLQIKKHYVIICSQLKFFAREHFANLAIDNTEEHLKNNHFPILNSSVSF